MVLEKTLESPLDPASPSIRRSVLGAHWKDWCWSWNSTTLATWCEELTHLKIPWCWEGLRAGGEGDDRGWDGWMASPTRWTWVWVNSGSWWGTGRPGVLWFMGSQRVRHNWATELNWTELNAMRPKGELKVKVSQSCLTLWDPVDYTVHRILQVRILEWVAFSFSRRSSQPRDQTQVCSISGRFFTSGATGEPQEYWSG